MPSTLMRKISSVCRDRDIGHAQDFFSVFDALFAAKRIQVVASWVMMVFSLSLDS